MRKFATRITPEIIEIIRSMSATYCQDKIARAAGVAQSTVARVQKRFSIPHMTRNEASVVRRKMNQAMAGPKAPKGNYSAEWRAQRSDIMRRQRATPEFEAKRLIGHRKQLGQASQRLADADCEVPAWVPGALVDQFRDLFFRVGEFEAAAWARRTKRSIAP